MKTSFATLALLLAALPAQLDWRDVRLAAVSAQPIVVGNEIGILFVSDSRTPFVFRNSTSQQLRVHEVYWYLVPCCGIQQETLKLVGHETTCQRGSMVVPVLPRECTATAWCANRRGRGSPHHDPDGR